MIVKPIDIQTPDGISDGYAIYPSEDGSYPGVLLAMDGIGLRPALIGLAERIAERGYYVLLPNLFYRSGKAPLFDYEQFTAGVNREETAAKMMSLIGQLNPEAIEHDATAFLSFLEGQPQVQSSPIGVTGYCMGGGFALRTAAYHPEKVAAAASFHGGRLATESPESPHLLVGQIKAELYIGHAKNDRSCPEEQIERLEAALDAAGIAHQTDVYDAGHGWTMTDVAVYDEAAAEKAFSHLIDLFERKLGPAASD